MQMKRVYVVREGGGVGMTVESKAPVIIKHGAPRISRKRISGRFLIRGVVRWQERRQCVVVCGGRLVQDDTGHVNHHRQ